MCGIVFLGVLQCCDVAIFDPYSIVPGTACTILYMPTCIRIHVGMYSTCRSAPGSGGCTTFTNVLTAIYCSDNFFR